MKDINAERLEALEWAVWVGYVIMDRDGFFVATSNDETKPRLGGKGSLRALADELAQMRARVEGKP